VEVAFLLPLQYVDKQYRWYDGGGNAEAGVDIGGGCVEGDGVSAGE
jgi:hypothetical protein